MTTKTKNTNKPSAGGLSYLDEIFNGTEKNIDDPANFESGSGNKSGVFEYQLKPQPGKNLGQVIFLNEGIVHDFHSCIAYSTSGKKYFPQIPCLVKDCPYCLAGDNPKKQGIFLVIDLDSHYFKGTGKNEERIDVRPQLKFIKKGKNTVTSFTETRYKGNGTLLGQVFTVELKWSNDKNGNVDNSTVLYSLISDPESTVELFADAVGTFEYTGKIKDRKKPTITVKNEKTGKDEVVPNLKDVELKVPVLDFSEEVEYTDKKGKTSMVKRFNVPLDFPEPVPGSRLEKYMNDGVNLGKLGNLANPKDAETYLKVMLLNYPGSDYQLSIPDSKGNVTTPPKEEKAASKFKPAASKAPEPEVEEEEEELEELEEEEKEEPAPAKPAKKEPTVIKW